MAIEGPAVWLLVLGGMPQLAKIPSECYLYIGRPVFNAMLSCCTLMSNRLICMTTCLPVLLSTTVSCSSTLLYSFHTTFSSIYPAIKEKGNSYGPTGFYSGFIVGATLHYLHLLNGVYSSNMPQAQGMLYIHKYFNVIGSDYISNKEVVNIQIINPAIATPVSAVTDNLFWHEILEVLSFGSYSCLARPQNHSK